MNDIATIPPQLTILGQALRPCLAKLNSRLDTPVLPCAYVADGVSALQGGLDRLQNLTTGLNDQFEQLMRDILANENACDADVYRNAGRFEAYLDRFLDERDAVRRQILAADFAEARDLLAGAYRHTLVEIRDWLAQFIDILNDPLAELRRRGLPTTGPVELPLALTLTSSPEIARLDAWAKRKQSLQGKVEHLGFWGVLGAAGLGYLIADALFDDDCGGCGPAE